MPNDLHVRERHAPLVNHEHRHQPGEMRYRYFLGVKWSQVQILSARQQKGYLIWTFPFPSNAHTFDRIQSCHRLSQEIDWCHRTHVRTRQSPALDVGGAKLRAASSSASG